MKDEEQSTYYVLNKKFSLCGQQAPKVREIEKSFKSALHGYNPV
jgi:hypothetical protein